MKKLILSLALLAGMTFVACSSDDDNGSVNDNCQTCELTEATNFEVCEGPDGTVVVEGIDSGLTVAQYITANCDNDTSPATNCVTCAEYTVQGQTVPAFEVCEGDNGNAVVGGIDSGVAYSTAIQGYELLTDCQ
ncbi:MAG: hypothetical protein BM557_10315 [Flavobacterium sp. MedPE-SWcel]|uniref:hypothetical protein n=1 Tax=uncultured Flavobacterium sp. TaxID=165435 RepID=UPI0009170AE0|nr:hypothetical protein [uncultured Flavobacterium sp.]OIQ16256.1 MAG: hypothetical protein BM557_10315 [Flavobacterium sp. MedPE-SWcel]